MLCHFHFVYSHQWTSLVDRLLGLKKVMKCLIIVVMAAKMHMLIDTTSCLSLVCVCVCVCVGVCVWVGVCSEPTLTHSCTCKLPANCVGLDKLIVLMASVRLLTVLG